MKRFFEIWIGLGFILMAIAPCDARLAAYAFTGMLVWAITLKSCDEWQALAERAMGLVDLLIEDMKKARSKPQPRDA